MGTRAPLTLRIPLVLLAAANLAILGMRLWPWPEVRNLPGNGATGLDPAVSLLGYIVLILFIADTNDNGTKKALAAGALLGLLAGAILVAQVVFDVRPGGQSGFMRVSLLVAAAIVCGIAGLRGARITGNGGIGMLSGLWCGMAASLMACAAVLAEINLSAPAPVTLDAWKQYQGLAIGNAAIQALVHSLNTASRFLLIGPLVGAAVGLVFAFFGQNTKS